MQAACAHLDGISSERLLMRHRSLVVPTSGEAQITRELGVCGLNNTTHNLDLAR